MKRFNFALVGLVSILLIQGCSTKQDLYYWGEYQQVIQDIYLEPGKADVQTQIYKLNLTIERAENYGMKVPPGLFAHLGMVHAQIGNIELARESLLQEKALYPEASTFIDGILSRSNLGSSDKHAQYGDAR
jgi:hypothetical protein